VSPPPASDVWAPRQAFSGLCPGELAFWGQINRGFRPDRSRKAHSSHRESDDREPLSSSRGCHCSWCVWASCATPTTTMETPAYQSKNLFAHKYAEHVHPRHHSLLPAFLVSPRCGASVDAATSPSPRATGVGNRWPGPLAAARRAHAGADDDSRGAPAGGRKKSVRLGPAYTVLTMSFPYVCPEPA
jgi:hypothetical protein